MNELLSALMGVGILIVFGALVVYFVAKMAEFLRNRRIKTGGVWWSGNGHWTDGTNHWAETSDGKLPPENDKDILRRKGVIR